MFKLITRLLSNNNNNSKPSNKGSFVRLGVNFEGELDKELLIRVLSLILSISVAGGGAYGIFNMIRSSNAVESKNPVNQLESMEHPTNLEQDSL